MNQKADAATVTALAQTVEAKADQTALDLVETTLTAANRLIFLSQVTLGSSVSAYNLNLPDWSDACELQIHYNIEGDGCVKLSFNNYADCYDTLHSTAVTTFNLKLDSRDYCAGVITLRPCGPSSQAACFVSGISMTETGSYASYTDILCSVTNVTVQTLTKLKFESDSGVVKAGSWFRLYKLL